MTNQTSPDTERKRPKPDTDSLDDSGEMVSEEEKEDLVVGTVEAATLPDRNLEHLDDILWNLQKGDRVEITLGTASARYTKACTVINTRGRNGNRMDHLNWEYSVELAGPEGDDNMGRLYQAGVGDDTHEPWFVYSHSYYRDLEIIQDETQAAHGWILNARKLPEGW